MKKLVAAAWGFLAISSPGWCADIAAQPKASPAAPATDPWTVVAATDVRYFSWQSDLGYPTRAAVPGSGGSGAELYIPFAAQISGRLPNPDFKLDMVARGGWVWARQSSGTLSGEVATSTDTVASATVTYFGWRGLQPFASVATNLPTGRSALNGSAANARMDPDLVDIATFGEGFNIGPTIGFNLPISNSLIVTASAGYTWRGPFDRENGLDATDPNVQTPARIDPGDVFTVTGGIAYKTGALVVNLTGSLSTETETVQNSAPLYKPGLRYLGNATVAYTWADTGVTTLTAAASHTNRNEVLFLGTSALVTEVMNTNSNLYRVGLQHLFPIVKQRFYLGPIGTFLFRDQNGYDSATLQFVPAKERWSAGALMRYASSDNVVWNARAERVWTHEDEDPAPGGMRFSDLANAFVPGSGVPIVSSTGWQFVGGVEVKF
jgi:hypothetical protein